MPYPTVLRRSIRRPAIRRPATYIPDLIRPALLMLLTASPALAWEHTVDYRFRGDEIAGYTVTEAADEDPTVLHVDLNDPNGGPLSIEIESDLGLGDCAEVLRYAQGNPGVIIVLTANLNAQTMNGVTLVQCSER